MSNMFLLLLFFCNLMFINSSNPTTITNYIGRWFQLYGDPNVLLYSGYGSTINTYDDRLSSKKLQRMAGYGYKRTENNSTYYTVYFENLPLDGTYLLLQLNSITAGYYKYSIYVDNTGYGWVWGKETDGYTRPTI